MAKFGTINLKNGEKNMNDKQKILELEKKLKELQPEFDRIEKNFEEVAEQYNRISREKQALQNEIDAIKKKMQVETFNKKVGKGELMSFRTFFDEIKKGRDFAGKTVVWSFKNGASGMFVCLSIYNGVVKKKLLESYHEYYIYDPTYLINIVLDFPSLKFDEFKIDAFTIGSMVDGRTLSDKKLDDIFIFICDTKTLDDFKDFSATEGLFFFERLPHIEESSGKCHMSENTEYFSIGNCGIPKAHFKNYKLYPLKSGYTAWKR